MTKTPEELTEDWKAGELEYGQYWVKNKVWEKPFIDRWLPNCSWKISCKDAIEQILAPVPTYDEYKAMQAELAELKEKIKKREELIQCLGSNIDELDVKKSVLIIENNKLRALLKGCQEVLSNICEENDWNSEYSTPLDVWDIMIRINEVLK
jgi:hypothetical protein